MVRFEFTKSELEEISDKALLSPLQKNLIEYRIRNYSIIEMSMKEHKCEATIKKELHKAVKKIEKVI